MFQKLLTKENYLALTGDCQTTYLTRLNKTKSHLPKLDVLAMTAGSLDVDVTLPRLLAGASGARGNVALSLPLSCFEVLILTIPKIPDEAVAKTLPYHLAKNLDCPLSDFIYDWQITRRHQETLHISVYLYPAAAFHRFNQELTRHNLPIKFFEADVFSAFSYLEQQRRLSTNDAVVCVLIWANSISFAVYENQTIVLSRTVQLLQPESSFEADMEKSAETLIPEESPGPLEEDSGILELEDETDISIFSDFNLLREDNEEALELEAGMLDEEKVDEIEPEVKTTDSREGWDVYIQKLNLEIMRTRDYYTSVVKGSAIKTVIVGGDEKIWDRLRTEIKQSLDVRVEALSSPEITTQCPPLFNVVGLGAILR